MEFGIFVQGYTPQFRPDVDPDAEHHALMNELELVKAADEAGFKYVWATEHHFLDEYSHLSANEVFLRLPRALHRAHPPRLRHLQPAPPGEPPGQGGREGRDARPPLRRSLRVRHRARRGQPRDPRVPARHGRPVGHARDLGRRDRASSPRCGCRTTYEGYQGKYWSLPPRKILPKPYVKPHPPMWYAAGNTSSYEMAARNGLGVLGFSVGSIDELAPVLEAYKREIVQRGADRRVRERQRDGHQRGVRRRGPRGGRAAPWSRGRLVVPAEQRVPLPRHVPAPRLGAAVARAAPRPDRRRRSGPRSGRRATSWAHPDHALEAVPASGPTPAPTSSSFGHGHGHRRRRALETIRLIGEHVIPKIDNDPEHRTSRFRREAGTRADPRPEEGSS